MAIFTKENWVKFRSFLKQFLNTNLLKEKKKIVSIKKKFFYAQSSIWGSL